MPAGVHVRFRLGGSCFPPLLFYKIYTRRPIADIGTFCPRDYANEALLSPALLFNKRQKMEGTVAGATTVSGPAGAPSPAAVSHTCAQPVFEPDFAIPEMYRRYVKPDGTVGLRSTRGWYQRQENNGWRPVNEVKMIDGEDELGRSRAPQAAFHLDSAERRRERARRRKQRRRDWMVALYRSDVLRHAVAVLALCACCALAGSVFRQCCMSR